MSENPYQAPAAALETAFGNGDRESGELREPRGVAVGRGWGWIREGFGLFKRQPGLWVLLSMTVVLIQMGLSMVPVVSILNNFFMFLFMAGMYFAAEQTANDGDAAFPDLFVGFRENTLRLLKIALVNFFGTLLAVGLSLGLTFGPAMYAESGLAQGATDPALFGPLTILVAMAVFLPVAMATWFATPLVILEDVKVLPALRMSFMACLRNILPLFVYGLALAALFLLGALPLLLGLLVVVPLMILSSYTAYRDIFYSGPAPA
ncbi:MAG: BPSS1780 family membrane protein [Thiohalorhabdus sp.]|uniref:BPSS1780 family membrane protein n=1 Tax=Thiohalorhabdus sp. TaxID=3094134 RepID=UPI00397FFE8C